MRRLLVMSLIATAVALSPMIANPAEASTVTVFGTTAPLESTWATDDHSALELGLRLTTTQAGYVTSVRFFKNDLDSGPHSAHVWDSGGSLLASADFSGESASGWQTQKLSTPVYVDAGSTFTVSVLYPQGAWYPREVFASTTVGPFTSLKGTYNYSATPAFPQAFVEGRNYFIDLEYGSAASYSTTGYLAPVKSDTTLTVRGGSTVPLKFQVMNSDTEVTTPDLLDFSVSPVSCEGAPPADPIDVIDNTGTSSLRYDTTSHQFIQNWKVPKTRGSCYLVRHAISGEVLLSALFRTA